MPNTDKNKISVIVATAVGLGAIIGAGIFVLSGTAIALAGRNALIAFLFVGVVALIVGLELSELGSLMPKVKGASYSYTYKAFGSELGFITGNLLYFSYATAISAVALGFGSYLSSIFGLGGSLYSIVFAIGLIFVLSVINIMGIKRATKADSFLVVIKIGILAIFIAFALIVAFSTKLPFTNLSSIVPASSGIGAIFAASVVIFFAYSGFQSISTFTTRIKGGSSGAAKAIIASIIISIILYVLVVFCLLLLLPAKSFTISADPLASALKNVSAPVWIFLLVSVGALIATASATLTNILTSSRTLYQIGNDGLLPKFTKVYNKKRDVATNGVMLSAVIGVIMLFFRKHLCYSCDQQLRTAILISYDKFFCDTFQEKEIKPYFQDSFLSISSNPVNSCTYGIHDRASKRSTANRNDTYSIAHNSILYLKRV